MKRTVLSAAMMLALVGEANAVCFVNASASGADDGKTWANAYVDLQSALKNGSCTEIWVAKGVYMPSDTDVTVSFFVKPAVAVYGGFNGTETLRADRRPDLHVTVLSGDVGKDDLDASYDNIDIDPSYIVGTNSNAVLQLDGSRTPVTSATVIDGFTITGGDSPDSGGGFLAMAQMRVVNAALR